MEYRGSIFFPASCGPWNESPGNYETSATSVRNGLGAPAAPRGNCQEDWTGPDDNFHAVPSWDILGLQS